MRVESFPPRVTDEPPLGRAWRIAPDHFVVAALVVLAFALRLVVRLARGEAIFLDQGYTFYLSIARTLVAGGGFCSAPGGDCVTRMPAYPLMLASFVSSGWVYPGVAIVQAALGAAMVWLTWRLGRELFDARAGLLAAAMTAFNPYALIHDTALQDTILVNAFLLLGVTLLLSNARPQGRRLVGGGMAFAVAVLASGRVGFILPVAILWAALCVGGDWRSRLCYAALVLLPALVLVGGWMVRNWRITGVPVVNTQVGYALWVGNNPWTFSHFPIRSIDLSAAEAWAHLPPDRRAALSAAHSELAFSQISAAMAVDHIRTHPMETLWGAVRKIFVVLSAQLSPARDALTQAGYALVYGSVRLLALFGFWQSRTDWRRHSLIWGLLLGFLATTAIYWSHTSHTSVIDAILFVYAGAALSHFAARLDLAKGRSAACPQSALVSWSSRRELPPKNSAK